MTWLFDSHIHLSDCEYNSDIDFIIESMKQLKIKGCCVSIDISTSQQTLELAKKSELILPFIGIHPEHANDNLACMVEMIENNSNTISGIGEIGLDPTYITSTEEQQIQTKVFETMLSLAERFNKPISIHSRKSLDNIFEIMTSYDTKHALLHWFDGSKKQLSHAMDMKYFVSFGPVTVYASDKQTLLSNADENKILVETDGPVRFSKCFEMKIAQISFIPSIVFCASKLLGKSFDDMSTLLEKNTKAYLGI